jgi:hypothetical protein
MKSTCKLCQSFATSQFPTAAERKLPGSDKFTRDPDICDACLDQDYGRRSRFSVVEAFSLLAGLLVAAIAAGALVARGFVPVAESRPLTFVVLAAGGTPVLGAIVWFLLHLVARVRSGSALPQDPKERAADAERFYWLAVWASLTGRARYRQRMLKQAQAMGLTDRRRLFDRRLGDVA